MPARRCTKWEARLRPSRGSVPRGQKGESGPSLALRTGVDGKRLTWGGGSLAGVWSLRSLAPRAVATARGGAVGRVFRVYCDALHARADAAEDLVGDRVAPAGVGVDASRGDRVVAEQRHLVADARRRAVGQVDGGQVHADPADDGARLPLDDDDGAIGVAARIAVG